MRLERGNDAGGRRDFLDGRAVHCGAMIEIAIGGGWHAGHYEWSGHHDDKPKLYLEQENGAAVVVVLDGLCWLRWPSDG